MAAKDLFTKVKQGLPKATEYFEANEPFEIPVFEDMYGNTAIDEAMGLAEDGSWKISFKKKKN